MSGIPNGHPGNIGFPHAPNGQGYQPVAQFPQYNNTTIGAPGHPLPSKPVPSPFPSNGLQSQVPFSAPQQPPFQNVTQSFSKMSVAPPPPSSFPSSLPYPPSTSRSSPFPTTVPPSTVPSQPAFPPHPSSFPSQPPSNLPPSGPPSFPSNPSFPSSLPQSPSCPFPNPTPPVPHAPSFPSQSSLPPQPASFSQPPPPSSQQSLPPQGLPYPSRPGIPPSTAVQGVQYPPGGPQPPPAQNVQYPQGGQGAKYPTGGYPAAGLANHSLSDYFDLSTERNPMLGGIDEISYSIPPNSQGIDVRCDPAIFRSTLNAIPQTEELLQKSRLPLGLTLHPFRDMKHLNVIRASTIVRCRYCRTYINPFVFLPDARRWKCNLCYKANDLPDDFCYDSGSQKFTAATNRPEMQQATVEFIAPSEYMLRPPQPTVYVFILDVSTPAIQSGYLHTLCEQVLISLDQMPGDDRTLITVIAVDSSLHFFQFHNPNRLPRELVVDDIDEMFVPSSTGILVRLKQFKESLRQLFQQLPSIYSSPSASSSFNCLGAALTVAKELISELGGRVSVFQCSLPNIGPGAIKPREESKQGEVDVTPSTDFYKILALDCTAVQMGIDLFVISTPYVDLATLAEMAKFSSGSVYRFPGFHAIDNAPERKRFEKVVTRYLTRKIGFEAVLRIRCSRGIGISSFYGNFFVRSTDLLSLANVNPDSAVGVQLNIEEKLGVATVCFQAALLYTSSKGDRRIRVHTLCLPTTSELTTLFAHVDVKATVSLLAKMGVDRACQGASLADCREALVNASVDGLGAFSKTAGRTGLLSPRGGQLKFLPLFSLALLKHPAFAAGRGIRMDDRVAAMLILRSTSIDYIITDVYPLLYKLNDVSLDEHAPEPRPLPLSFEYVTRDGVYLMVAGHSLLIYVAASSDPSFVQELFGTNYQQLDAMSFREQSTETSKRMHAFVSTLIYRMQIYNTPLVIREDSPLRSLFVSRFVDDRSESSHSYVEFVNHIKKEIGH